MKVAIRDRRLYIRTHNYMMSFGFRPFLTFFSFRKLDRDFEHLFVSARANAIKALGGQEVVDRWDEYAQRGAEAARKAGENDIRRYSRMLQQYLRTGTCEGWGGHDDQTTVDLSKSTSSDSGTR